MNNHIFLMIGYIQKLMDLAMIQHWIDGARVTMAKRPELIEELDRRQADLIAEKTKLQDEMFEIARSN